VTKRNRVFLGILLIYALGVIYLLYRVSADLDPRYQESAEESLVETAHLLSSLIEADLRDDGQLRSELLRAAFARLNQHRFRAKIYSVEKTRIDLRVYVTDRNGKVIFDSIGMNEGKDFLKWRDVFMTLKGEYGARTTQDLEGIPETAVMYVGAPIRWNSEIVGAVTVGKPVQSFGKFVTNARQKLLVVGLTAGSAAILLAFLVAVWLARPFGLLHAYVRLVRDRKGNSLPRMGRRAIGVIGAAYDEMRDALAGRNYVEEYVQTLTHEIKSPLSAIRGAAELLQEPMAEERREQFLKNIRDETQRIQDLVDRLLELSSLEKRRGLADVQVVALDELLHDVIASLAPLADAKRVTVRVAGVAGVCLRGERFLLHRALANLLQNAIDFSPAGQEVGVSVRALRRHVEISIRDHGPGIPDYAIDRVFEKFYSLTRPDSGKKGTGLGLSFVKEIAELHRGKVELRNDAAGGAVANLVLPSTLPVTA
jgi:two-component system, OmpR family, sensor histidine kinase CreC